MKPPLASVLAGHRVRPLIGVFCFAVFVVGWGLRAHAAPGPDLTDRLIVEFRSAEGGASDSRPLPDALERLSALAGVRLTFLRPMSGGAHVLRLPRALP